MSIKIDCPDCDGSGAIPTMPDGEPEMCRQCEATGKITVYTQEELDEKIGYVEGLYTPEELQKAVMQEREACIWICDQIEKVSESVFVAQCIEAIRARSKE